jgi:hypothetical protein
MNKRKALSKFLGCKKAEIEVTAYDENTFDAEGCEYLVLTDCEADEMAQEYIADSLWAFNPSFLADETGVPEEMFKCASEMCEDANEGFLKAVESTCGLVEFAESAIRSDGRGHFLSTYDGNENEQNEYYIYRTN